MRKDLYPVKPNRVRKGLGVALAVLALTSSCAKSHETSTRSTTTTIPSGAIADKDGYLVEIPISNQLKTLLRETPGDSGKLSILIAAGCATEAADQNLFDGTGQGIVTVQEDPFMGMGNGLAREWTNIQTDPERHDDAYQDAFSLQLRLVCPDVTPVG